MNFACFAAPFEPLLAAHQALWAHLFPDSIQRLAPLFNVDQRQHRKRAVRILGQSPVTYLGKAPDTLEREKRMLHLGPCLALGAIDLFVPLSQWRVAAGSFVREVFSLGRFGFECTLLAPVGAVAIQPGLVAMLVKLPSCWLSCSLAAVTLALWISPVALSTPMCAFMPKYHCPALKVWCISGSRALS